MTDRPIQGTRPPDPTVSIVIPTYNHAPLVQRALRSVIAQTLPDWEAIVINNYSQDDTEAVVAAFGDPRIRLVNFRNHGVIAASRNQGIREARGRWIAFLDSDDVWCPEKLAACLTAAVGGVELVCHAEEVVRGGKRLWTNHYGPEPRATFRSLLFERNRISTSAVVVAKTALERVGGFREEPSIVTSEDYDLWLRLAKSGVRMRFLSTPLGEYQLHETNQSQAALRHLSAVREVVLWNYSTIERPSPLDRLRLRRRLAYAMYYAGRNLGEQGNYSRSFAHLGRSAMEFPFAVRPYAGSAMVAARMVRKLWNDGWVSWRART